MHDFHQRQIIPGKLYDITDRTIDGGTWFVPALRSVIVDAISRAQKVSKVKLYGYVVMSNHYHALASADGPREMAKFLELFHAEVGRHVNRFHARQGRLWAKRASVVRVSDEPAAQVARLRYILSNSVKELAAAHPADWTGPHVAHAFETGRPEGQGDAVVAIGGLENEIEGLCQRAPSDNQHGIAISQLPHLAQLSADEYFSDMRHLMSAVANAPTDRDAGIEANLLDGASKRAAPCAPPSSRPGWEPRKIVMDMSPPVTFPRRPRPGRGLRGPFVFASDKEVRTALIDARKAFLAKYVAASEAYREGRRGAPHFPWHSFAPVAPWLVGDAKQPGLFEPAVDAGAVVAST